MHDEVCQTHVSLGLKTSVMVNKRGMFSSLHMKAASFKMPRPLSTTTMHVSNRWLHLFADKCQFDIVFAYGLLFFVLWGQLRFVAVRAALLRGRQFSSSSARSGQASALQLGLM